MKRITISIILFIVCFPIFAQQNILSGYHKTAIDSSAALKAVYLKYEMAIEKILQASALPNPQVSFAYGLNPVETRLGPQQAKISVMQMFPWFGTLSAKEQQAAKLATASYEEYILQRSNLIFDVSASWYQLCFYSQSIIILKKQIEILEMLERQANIKFENNKGAMVDVLRFQMAKEELEAKIQLVEDQKKTTLTQFNSLLNRNPDTKVNIADTLKIPNERIFSLDSVLQNNPRLKILKAKYAATKYQLKVVQKSGYPTIGIGLDYVFIGNRTDMQVDNTGSDAIMPMVSISIPLYRKKYKATENEVVLSKEQIANSKIAMKNTLTVSFEKAIQDYNNAKRNINLYQSLLSKSNQVRRILQTAYVTSGKDYDQLLTAQNTVLKYQIAYSKSISDLYKAIAYLEFLSIY